MSLFRVYQAIFIISLVCIFSHLAEATDISTLQTALELARGDMDKAKDKHEADTKAVTQQQHVITEQKQQLADSNSQLDKMQKDTKQDWAQYLEAKQKFDKAQANLNAAWGK